MEQRSKEWFKARKGKITGSNAGAILGLAPYRNADDVMRAMVRDFHGAESEFDGNVATEYGTFHEAGAQTEYEMETGNTVTECGFIAHPEHEWLGASPDGLVIQEGAVLEIKCPYGLRNKDMPEFKPIKDQPHYYAQVQIEMYCAGAPACHFYQWAPKGTKLEIVEADPEYIEKILPELKAFYDKYLVEVNNPEHIEPKRKEINTLSAARIIEEYAQLSDAIEMAQEKKKELLEKLVKMAGESNALICGRKLTKVETKGSISYAKAIKKLLPDADLEPYRGKPKSYWTLK